MMTVDARRKRVEGIEPFPPAIIAKDRLAPRRRRDP